MIILDMYRVLRKNQATQVLTIPMELLVRYKGALTMSKATQASLSFH